MIWVLLWVGCGLVGSVIAIFVDENCEAPTRLEFITAVVMGLVFLLFVLFKWAECTEFWNKPIFRKQHD